MSMMFWGMGASAIASAFQAYTNAQATKSAGIAKSIQIQQQAYQYKSKALQDEVQAGAYIVQGKAYEYQQSLAEMNASQANNQMYKAYEMGAWLAMQQGFADREKLSATKVAAAHSGVKMDEGSKREVYQSEYLKKELNRIALQKQTVSAANKARLAEANYRGQGVIAGGNANAAKLMSQAVLDIKGADNTMADVTNTLSQVPLAATNVDPLWSAIAAGTQSLTASYMMGYDYMTSGSRSANIVSKTASNAILSGVNATQKPTPVVSSSLFNSAKTTGQGALSGLGKTSWLIF